MLHEVKACLSNPPPPSPCENSQNLTDTTGCYSDKTVAGAFIQGKVEYRSKSWAINTYPPPPLQTPGLARNGLPGGFIQHKCY